MAFKKGVVVTMMKCGSVVGVLCVGGGGGVGGWCVIVVIRVCVCGVRGVIGGVVV
jgi:hypothetical protein